MINKNGLLITFRATATALLCCLTAGLSVAEPLSDLSSGKGERITFASVTPKTRFKFVQHSPDNKPVTVWGDLFMPPNATTPVPAVVILHGSSGANAAMYDVWAKNFVSWGYAAFVVDSFAPRNVSDTMNNSGNLDTSANTADALNALKLLAADPRIDKNRIANIGFSRGGGIAIDTYFDMYRHGVIADDLKFAANIPVYPNGCHMKYRADQTNTNRAPMLFLLAEKDDSLDPKVCIEYINELNTQSGLNVQYKMYKGAYHAFDAHVPWHFNRGGETPRNCNVEINMSDVPGSGVHGRDLKTNADINGWDDLMRAWHACRSTNGYTAGGDENHSATNAALADVHTFLSGVFSQ